VTSQPAEPDEPVIQLANEFTEVVVERVRTRNGARLRISVPSSGRAILLCPLELEALTWQDHELFSRLLETPHGPEDDGPQDGAPASDPRGHGGPTPSTPGGPSPSTPGSGASPSTPGGG
jgi:hypothetical protein